MIGVVVAEDQAMVRGGFCSILSMQADIQVLGEASDGLEAIAVAKATTPDVVLMDVRMPNLDGIEATRRLIHVLPDTRVLMLTTFDLSEYLYAAMKAGASGFLLKDAPPETLADAVRTIARGDALLAPELTRRLLDEFVRRPQPGSGVPPRLRAATEREREVLALLAHGLSNSEIAASLFLSEATVKTHVTHLLTKLRLRDRVQAVVLAYETGLVSPGDDHPHAP
jgi:DNA-binding NarL/FixJ family response regulator